MAGQFDKVREVIIADVKRLKHKSVIQGITITLAIFLTAVAFLGHNMDAAVLGALWVVEAISLLGSLHTRVSDREKDLTVVAQIEIMQKAADKMAIQVLHNDQKLSD